ncbi:hypothetical protein CANMA_000866 [Candida margitis]|uniref:uncharacterized protein n=1 Tax=Candida margitis TaxID=1775924 RepID=UPI0022264494|nr:uncharacterized protein CANMA_000866 [Candida margitis]KAI5970042.1 hypothetical protein CANMA_000866 [Candida margitis]
MPFKTPKLEYKAWAYKNGNNPIELIQESVDLVKSSSGDYIAPDGKILIKINYASLNPVDYKLYKAKPAFIRFINSKQGFGKDYSGQVVSIGNHTSTKVKVGDLVQGIQAPMIDRGSCAEYLLLDPTKSPIATKATNIDLAKAASFPLVLGTAMQISRGLKIKDEKILILGAGTSVGRYAVQLCRIKGAKEIVTTNSGKNADLISDLGATSQIDYRKNPNILQQVLESVKESGPFDHILDTVGGKELFPEIKHILKKGGAYHTTNPGSSFFAYTSSLLRKKLAAWGFLGYDYSFGFLDYNGGWIDSARDLVQSGQVKLFIDSVYQFNDLHQAIDKLNGGRAQGKILLEVAKPTKEEEAEERRQATA